MDPETSRHLIGFAGVVVSNGLSMSVVRTVKNTRASGNLGGLDTREWPLYFYVNAMWTVYSVILGDIWLFLSVWPPAVCWMYYCCTAIRLLAQEEGELLPSSPHTTTGVSGWEEPAARDLDKFHKLSSKYRMQRILATEQNLTLGFALTCLICFICGGRSFAGFEVLDQYMTPALKDSVFSSCCGLASVICYGTPLRRLWTLIKRRDASSVFGPYVIAQLLANSLWFVYGLVTSSASLMSGNGLGIFCATMQLILKVIFWNGPGPAKASVQEADAAGPGGEVAAAGEGWLTIAPAPNTRVVSAAAPATDVAMTDPEVENIDRLEHGLVSAIALPGAHERHSSAASSTAASTPGPSPRPSRHGRSLEPLPDLTDLLKEQGIYEDYLKWQRDYQKWRKGGTKGAHGEMTGQATVIGSQEDM
mmetsp:Transcript_38634/g.124118  ORF Transcript_38634/g.124118 Transcript_38634/m.124118 type:complete len:419 (+) Transcript_38634:63-1319(+)